MKYSSVFYFLGRLLCIISGLMALPALTSFWAQESSTMWHFICTALLILFCGIVLMFVYRKSKAQPIMIRDGFLLVTLAWVSISLLGSIPYILEPAFGGIVNAFFESVSGFTTTGATILSDIEVMPKGILLWRSLSQWIGGLGIIVLAVAILPQLSVGGMQLMKNEMPGPTFEHLKPRIRQTAMSLWKIYILFSVVLFGILLICKMDFFDAICTMFSTMSSGGFATRNASMGAFSPMIQGVVTVFMFLAGMNFVLHHAWLSGNFQKVWRDTEWRYFGVILLIALLMVISSLTLNMNRPFTESLRYALFQVVSIATSTGFTTTDYAAWPFFAQGVLIGLMFVGGCAGSTSGGFKQIRMLLLMIMTKRTLKKQIFPKSIEAVKVGKRAVPEDVLLGVNQLFLVYLMIASLSSLVLLAYGFDFVTAASAVVASLSNVGPGLNMLGPTQTYTWCPTGVKLILSALMIVGRLEIFTVLVLFLPDTWRR